MCGGPRGTLGAARRRTTAAVAPGVDAHLQSCARCRGWLVGAAAHTRQLATASARRGPDLTDQILATVRARAVSTASLWWRGALIAVGVGQIAVAAAQIGGLDFGMVHTEGHGAATGAHLLHESTAWLVGLGVAMIAAGIWTVAAVGVSAVTGAYAVALIGYVAVDAASGQVTAARILSHIPILVGWCSSCWWCATGSARHAGAAVTATPNP